METRQIGQTVQWKWEWVSKKEQKSQNTRYRHTEVQKYKWKHVKLPETVFHVPMKVKVGVKGNKIGLDSAVTFHKTARDLILWINLNPEQLSERNMSQVDINCLAWTSPANWSFCVCVFVFWRFCVFVYMYFCAFVCLCSPDCVYVFVSLCF